MQKLQQESYRYVIWAIRHHQSINRHSVVCITVLHAKYDLFGGPGFRPSLFYGTERNGTNTLISSLERI